MRPTLGMPRPRAAGLAAAFLVPALAAAAFRGAPPVPAAAAGMGLDQVVERVERTYAAAADLTAHFRQTSTIVAAAQVQQASGTLAVKRPGKMRWEYAEPEPRLFVTDGRTFWAYSPQDRQVFVQETKGALGATPLAFLMGAGSLRQEFQVREVGHAAPGQTALLDLRPVTPNATMARLLLEVDLASSLIVQATVFDAVGNTIVLTLSDQKLNVGLPDSRFTFVPPPDAHMITGPSSRP